METKTKDEIIAAAKTGEHVINYHTPITPHDVHKAYFIGIETGVNVAYDHRQKEIDDANRWWAERWKVFYESGDQPTYNGIIDELNAAAARVMEVKG